VAAWLSEKVLRGRGPDASEFESHRRGGFFSRKEPSPGHGCVCMSPGKVPRSPAAPPEARIGKGYKE
jgi:hypothetical protein